MKAKDRTGDRLFLFRVHYRPIDRPIDRRTDGQTGGWMDAWIPSAVFNSISVVSRRPVHPIHTLQERFW